MGVLVGRHCGDSRYTDHRPITKVLVSAILPLCSIGRPWASDKKTCAFSPI